MRHREFLIAEIVLVTALSTSLFTSDGNLAARTEMHSFESVTVTDQQFLTGATDGKPVVIAGELRLPSGTGKLPAVVLGHGSGAVGIWLCMAASSVFSCS